MFAIRRHVICSLLFSCIAFSPVFAQPPAAVVVASPVIEEERAASETFVGSVRPKRRSIVGCAVDGRVLEFFVDEGDLVTTQPRDNTPSDKPQTIGLPIAQLRTQTLEIEIAVAHAQRAIRDNELRQLKKSLPEQLAQAKARRLSAEAKKKFAVSEHKRILTLFQSNRAVSRADLDSAESASVAAQQELVEATSTIKELEQTSDLKIAQADAKLLSQDEEIRRLNDLKLKYTIRAPFRGHVVKKFVEVGQWVKRGDPVVEVIELDPIEIQLSVPAHHIDRLQATVNEKTQQMKSITVDVWIDSLPATRFEGEVKQIVPEADRRSRSFPVKIEVANPHEEGHRIKPGMLARVALPLGQKKKMLLVHKDALVLGGRTKSVYVAATDPKTKMTSARPVAVQTGASFDSLIEVRGQLKAGDLVVVEGNERLRPGQPIRIEKENAKKDNAKKENAVKKNSTVKQPGKSS